MNFSTQLFFYVVLIPISLLPFPVLYFISDGLYLILFRIIGYRKKVVIQNVQKSFPQKSKAGQSEIVSEFYKHLCDLVVESIKVFTITEKQIQKRFKFLNPEFGDRFYDIGQSIIIAGGHKNNWELFAVAIDRVIKHRAVGIYKRLSNSFFDKKMCATRGRYGLKMVSTKETRAEFQNIDEIKAIIFGFDQSPRNERESYWAMFLNQETAMSFGVEKYAREFNYPILYGRINKVKRGYYNFEFTEVITAPLEKEEGAITRHVNSLLEKDIIAEPQYWLWSHKRWKFKRPYDVALH